LVESAVALGAERSLTFLLKACLNGNRKPGEHPALPLSPQDVGHDARRAVEAGAGALHVHPRMPDGSETLDANVVGTVVEAVRLTCPGVPVGVSTGAWIEPDLERRKESIGTWGSLPAGCRPDFASVNFSELGATEVCVALLDAGVGVEAGLWSAEDACLLLEADMAGHCTRVLIELVRERAAEEARLTAQEIETALDKAGAETPRLLHGEGAVAWPMFKYALKQGYDARIGFEDTLVLPGGAIARDNAQLVKAALELARGRK
jgi:uncharacterized protein (DUF849 family)